MAVPVTVLIKQGDTELAVPFDDYRSFAKFMKKAGPSWEQAKSLEQATNGKKPTSKAVDVPIAEQVTALTKPHVSLMLQFMELINHRDENNTKAMQLYTYENEGKIESLLRGLSELSEMQKQQAARIDQIEER